MVRSLFGLALLLLAGTPATAQMNYGGSAAPSLEVTLDITNDILRQEIGNRAANGGRVASQREAGSLGLQQSGPAAAGSFFASALQPVGDMPAPAVSTRFSRSKAMQKQSEATILAALKKRQPAAHAEYAAFFGKYDIAALFSKATKDFGFSPNDVADTMAAYWLVAWVVANNGAEPSPAAARAVRNQVSRGIARTDVAGFDPARRHQLADEAIFNMIILIELYDYAQKGRISRADFARAGDATQKAFLGFGADLRNLQLTDAGFQKR